MKLKKINVSLGSIVGTKVEESNKIIYDNDENGTLTIKGIMVACVETDLNRIVKYKVKINKYGKYEDVIESLNNGKLKGIIHMIAGIMHNNE